MRNQGDILKMHHSLKKEGEIEFEGLRFDICANSSINMSVAQYVAYCDEFGLPLSLKENTNRKSIGVEGHQKAIGTSSIQIPFINLKIVTDVDFIIIPAKLPKLLSMKYMITNGL